MAHVKQPPTDRRGPRVDHEIVLTRLPVRVFTVVQLLYKSHISPPPKSTHIFLFSRVNKFPSHDKTSAQTLHCAERARGCATKQSGAAILSDGYVQ